MAQQSTPSTLGEALRQTAARFPDAPALLSPERSLTWAELDLEADRVAALLVQLGVGPGDVVGFLLSKRPEVVTGFLATARVGAIMAPINFKLHGSLVADQVRTAGINAVFVEPAMDGVLGGFIDLLPDRGRVVVVGGRSAHGGVAYEHNRELRPLAEPFAARADTVCYYNYTSGTTGRPKGAVTTHENILANAVATIDGLGFARDDVFLGMFSVFAHPHELFHRSILVGGPFVVVDTLSPRVVIECIERFGVTWMMAVPSFYEMMLDYLSGVDRPQGLGTLRTMESGGAYVGAATLLRMEERSGATFVPVWGCTEASGVALANSPIGGRKPGATGRPIAGYEVAVFNDAGEPVPEGEIGELVLRGPAMALGYVNQPDETDLYFRRGWYHTQDLVRRDGDGFVQFLGRKSEMLKVGGIRVYPLEIERVLLQHPGILSAVVVRAVERVRGEIPRAIIEAEPGVTAKDVQAWCRDRLAVYKVPRIIEFWSKIPALPNGKVDKHAILAVTPDGRRDERS